MCDVGEYIGYKNCKCRKKIIDKLIIEECSEKINGNEMIYNKVLNSYKNACNSCTIRIVCLSLLFW